MVTQKPKYCKSFERNSHWRKLSMMMVWERYCNASPKPEFFLISLFIFSFISQLIWVHLGWNFHRWFSIQKQVNWCTIDPFVFVVLHKPTLLPSTFKKSDPPSPRRGLASAPQSSSPARWCGRWCSSLLPVACSPSPWSCPRGPPSVGVVAGSHADDFGPRTGVLSSPDG